MLNESQCGVLNQREATAYINKFQGVLKDKHKSFFINKCI